MSTARVLMATSPSRWLQWDFQVGAESRLYRVAPHRGVRSHSTTCCVLTSERQHRMCPSSGLGVVGLGDTA